jgi:H+-transporting ATPase
VQFIAAIISVTVKNDGDRGYTSFVLLILELNLVVWVGYYSNRNAGNAVKELEVPTTL